ncbi:hypothetical protein C8Q76DRAFT_243815 [Earliella scabrosa]|nr:hypothetical protein C8Q76DRAFT_243815 [Earliella scabrosa]
MRVGTLNPVLVRRLEGPNRGEYQGSWLLDASLGVAVGRPLLMVLLTPGPDQVQLARRSFLPYPTSDTTRSANTLHGPRACLRRTCPSSCSHSCKRNLRTPPSYLKLSDPLPQTYPVRPNSVEVASQYALIVRDARARAGQYRHAWINLKESTSGRAATAGAPVGAGSGGSLLSELVVRPPSRVAPLLRASRSTASRPSSISLISYMARVSILFSLAILSCLLPTRAISFCHVGTPLCRSDDQHVDHDVGTLPTSDNITECLTCPVPSVAVSARDIC